MFDLSCLPQVWGYLAHVVDKSKYISEKVHDEHDWGNDCRAHREKRKETVANPELCAACKF